MTYHLWADHPTSVPTVYLHSFSDNGASLWHTCHKLSCPPFNLVVLYDGDFDAQLSPWPAPGIRAQQPPFAGQAQAHLTDIVTRLIPEVESRLAAPSLYNALAGYSLAGLFTLWSAWHTTAFSRMACVSSSFWYPHFVEYITLHPMAAIPQCIYFSLGSKENKVRHPLMSQIDMLTQQVVQHIQSLNIATTFEMNPGNHFTEPDLRMAKGIRWMLTQA